jgi:hypothetical protein
MNAGLVLAGFRRRLSATIANWRSWLPLTVVMAVAAALRFPWLLYGLPVYWEGDEVFMTAMATRIAEGNLDPEWYFYPGLPFYSNGLIFAVASVLYDLVHSLGVGEREVFSGWYLFALGRGVNATMAVASVALTYLMARRIGGRRAAVASGLFLAIMPYHLYYSVHFRPETMLLFVGTVTLYVSLRYLEDRRDSLFLWACFWAGMTIGTKYLLAMPLAPLTAYCILMRREKRRIPGLLLLAGAGGIAAGYVLTTPYALVKPVAVLTALLSNQQTYRSGMPGLGEAIALPFFLRSLFATHLTPLLLVAALIGGGALALRRRAVFLVLFGAPVVWFLFNGVHMIRMMHNVVLIVVPLSIGAGYLISLLPGRLTPLVAFGLFAFFPLGRTLDYVEYRLRPDIRYASSAWINANTPDTCTVAREEYTAYFAPPRRSIDIFTCGLAAISPDSLRSLGVDYVITNRSVHDRFLNDPERYGKQIQQYRAHFDEFETVAEIEAGDCYQGGDQVILKVTTLEGASRTGQNAAGVAPSGSAQPQE